MVGEVEEREVDVSGVWGESRGRGRGIFLWLLEGWMVVIGKGRVEGGGGGGGY